MTILKIPTTTKYLNELTPHPENYNSHPASQIKELAESLSTFGQFKNIVTWTCPENMTTPEGHELHEGLTYILAGHGLWLAAMIVWHKINAKYAAINAQYKQRHEPCLYFKPKGSTLRWVGPTDECTLWEIKRDSVNEYHPTQKPIELAMRAIGNHSASIVIDCFIGSGSTIIASENLGRKCRAIEIDPGYAAVSIQRFYDLTGIEPKLITSGVAYFEA